jgi:hypothetical protein
MALREVVRGGTVVVSVAAEIVGTAAAVMPGNKVSEKVFGAIAVGVGLVVGADSLTNGAVRKTFLRQAENR